MSAPKCSVSGCKNADVDRFDTFGGRSIRLCDDHAFAWRDDEGARERAHMTTLQRIAVDAHVNAGRADEAQVAEVQVYKQETENRAYVDAWLSNGGKMEGPL